MRQGDTIADADGDANRHAPSHARSCAPAGGSNAAGRSADIRARCLDAIAKLPPEIRALEKAARPYPVAVSRCARRGRAEACASAIAEAAGS